jgi:diamine N-acetyltransferase
VELVPTHPADIEAVLALEHGGDADGSGPTWPASRHERAIADLDREHLLLVEDGRVVGFVVLAGLDGAHRSIELQRIVVSPAGAGVGRQALALVLRRGFAIRGAHRVWLAVPVRDLRARRACQAAGFVAEGRLRDAIRSPGGYDSLMVMSILEEEYRARSGDQDRV